MSILDPTSDYAVMDDLVRLTITSDDGALTVYDVYGRKTAISDRDIMAAGQVAIGVDDATFTLYPETLEGLIPQPRYVVTDSSGKAWTILNVTVTSYGGLPVSYRAISRKQV